MAIESNGLKRFRLGEIFSERKEPGRLGLPIMSVTMGSGIVKRDSLDHVVPEFSDCSRRNLSRVPWSNTYATQLSKCETHSPFHSAG